MTLGKLVASIATGFMLISCLPVAAAATSPHNMTLHLTDLPAGFALKTAHTVTIRQAARNDSDNITLNQYRAWGYQTGYEADYTQQGGLADITTGAAEIDSTASIYRNQHGARASWTATNANCSRHPACSHLSLGRRIGDHAGLYKVVQKTGGTTITAYFVVWTRGHIKAAVLAAGVAGGPSVASVVTLAAKQDRRIAGR